MQAEPGEINMPPSSQPQRRTLNQASPKEAPRKEAPRARHKAKPKFDLPVDAAAMPEAPVGWVYRAEEGRVSSQEPIVYHYQRESAEYHDRKSGSAAEAENAFLVVGKGLYL